MLDRSALKPVDAATIVQKIRESPFAEKAKAELIAAMQQP